MIVTNKHNHPAWFHEKCKKLVFKPSWSATKIFNPAKMFWLEMRHWDTLETDCDDMLERLIGTGFDQLILDDPAKCQKYVSAIIGGHKVSGMMDMYDNGEITDAKTCKAWKIKNKMFDDWRDQLLSYAVLCVENNMPAVKGKIFAGIKDGTKEKKSFGKVNTKYFPTKFYNGFSIDFTPEMIAEHKVKIEKQVSLLESTGLLPDDLLPACTDDERWARSNDAFFRCHEWCNAKAVCKQYQEGVKDGNV